LSDIQGELLVGMQKNAELFIFFRINDALQFKAQAKKRVIGRMTNARTLQEREGRVGERRRRQRAKTEAWMGSILGFAKDGLTQLLGPHRPRLDPAFERGADHPETIAVKVVHSEIGKVRPGAQQGHEHFGFRDGISQPGVRGVTRPSKPIYQSEDGLPGQDLLWPSEFVFCYPGQDPHDPVNPGPAPAMAAPWMRNGSFMVFRRLEQKVLEFPRFLGERAARLGMDRELLAARMVGRWKSGAPLELAPLHDNAALGADDNRNNHFEFGDDPFQRKCPYAAHIRKAYPRDDTGNEAEVQRHRIIRAGIPFAPEVEPGETTTRHSRGLMFVCYQTSIERQFEFIQRRRTSCRRARCRSRASSRAARALSSIRRRSPGGSPASRTSSDGRMSSPAPIVASPTSRPLARCIPRSFGPYWRRSPRARVAAKELWGSA